MTIQTTESIIQDVIRSRPGALWRLIERTRDLQAVADGPSATMSVAEEAEHLIGGPRRDDYGPVGDGFAHVARLWAPIIGVDGIEPRQVAACMVAWKLSRALTGAVKRDNYVDLVGYALLWEQIDRAVQTTGGTT